MKTQNRTRKDPYISLRYPEFRAYITMRFVLTFGYQMQAVIVGWHVYNLTKDPLSLGLIGLAEAIPSIGIALYGGYIADKSDKKKLLVWVLATMLVCSIILLVVTMPSIDAYLPNRIELWIIYLTIFCIGIARGFYAPTGFSLMSEMIPKEHYPNSATWHSSSWQLATIVGPAAGGLLYGYFGATACFLVIVVCMFISLVAIAFFVADHPPKFTPKENIFKSLLEGVQFVWKSKLMLSALSLDLFSVFFGGAVALMPIFADEILKVGAQGLGLLRAAPAIGAVLTMTLMTYYSPMNKPWRNLLLVLAGFGASIVCFGLSRNFYLSLAFLFCEGAFDSVSVIIRTNILQLLTPEGMRGRVSAVSSMFIGSSNELGAFESGVSARLMGVVPSVLFGGGMTLLIVGYTYLKTKAAFGLNTATFGEISAK